MDVELGRPTGTEDPAARASASVSMLAVAPFARYCAPAVPSDSL